MFLRAMLTCLVLTATDGYNIFHENNFIASENADIIVTSRPKRDMTSSTMAAFYDVTLRSDNKEISLKLRRQDVMRGLDSKSTGYMKNWAVYASGEVDGVFILHKSNTGNLTIEGTLVHENTELLVQKNETTGSHMIHQLRNFSTSSQRHFEKKRIKRNTPTYYIYQQTYIDRPLVRVVRDRLKPSGFEKMDLDGYFMKYVATMTTFVNERLKTLRDTDEHLEIRGSRPIILEKDIPAIKALPHSWNSVSRRRGSCDLKTLNKFTEWVEYRDWGIHNHAMLITGYDLNDGAGSYIPQGIAYVGAMCLAKQSTAVIEGGLNTRSFYAATHESMHGLGVDHDGDSGTLAERCSSSDGFLMAASLSRPYKERHPGNMMKFSSCVGPQITAFLRKHSATKLTKCLLSNRQLLKEPSDPRLGSTLSLEEQCKLIGGNDATVTSTTIDEKICTKGLHCKILTEKGPKIAKYVPFPGTPCGNGKRCVNKKCV